MYTEEELMEVRNNGLTSKKQFVQEIGKIISQFKHSISNVDYDIFADQHGQVYEYLVVTFNGGAITVRNCNCDSLTAVFRELGNLLDGGYYEEVKDYKMLKSKAERIEGLTCETPTE